MSAPLLTLVEAKTHLRVTSTVDDDDITLKTQMASDIVRNYLKTMDNPDWTDANVPTPIKAAVCLMLTHLYEDRATTRRRTRCSGPPSTAW